MSVTPQTYERFERWWTDWLDFLWDMNGHHGQRSPDWHGLKKQPMLQQWMDNALQGRPEATVDEMAPDDFHEFMKVWRQSRQSVTA